MMSASIRVMDHTQRRGFIWSVAKSWDSVSSVPYVSSAQHVNRDELQVHRRNVWIKRGRQRYKQCIDFQWASELLVIAMLYPHHTPTNHLDMAAVAQTQQSKKMIPKSADFNDGVIILVAMDSAAVVLRSSSCSISAWPPLTPKHCFVTRCYGRAYMLLGSGSLRPCKQYDCIDKMDFATKVLHPVLNTVMISEKCNTIYLMAYSCVLQMETCSENNITGCGV